MEHKDLDRLFKDGLGQESQFSNAEAQWAIVANRLKADKRRKGGWLPLLWVPLLGFVCTAFSAKFALDLLIQQAGEIITYQNSPLVEEENKLHQTALEISEIEGLTAVAAFNQPNKTAAEEEVLHHASLPSFLEQEKEESCHCPEEHIEPTSAIIEEDKNEVVYTPVDVFDKIPSCDIATIGQKNNKHSPPLSININREKRHAWHVFAGINQGFITDQQLVDTLQEGYYIGVGWQFKKRWHLAVTYSRNELKRGTNINPKTYHIPTDALPYETPYPTYTAVNYLNENMSLTLAFNVVHQKRLRLSPLAGIQLRKTSRVQAAYYFEGVYSQEIYYDRIDNEPFKLSDAMLGGRLEVPIYKGLSIESHYKYLISLQPALFDWQNRHRVQAGLVYHF